MNSFSVKDIQRALKYLEDKFKAVNVKMEIDENNRLNFQVTDMEANLVKIIVYRANDESPTKFPELLESRRLP